MRRSRFRLRLTLLVAGIFAVALGLAAVLGVGRFRATLEAEVKASAIEEVVALSEETDVAGSLSSSTDPDALEAMFYFDADGEPMTLVEFGQVYTEAFVDELLAEYPSLAAEVSPDEVDVPLITVEIGSEEAAFVAEVESGDVEVGAVVEAVGPPEAIVESTDAGSRVVASLPVEVGGVPVTVARASSLRTVDEAVAAVRRVLLVAVPALIALVALLTWYVTGRALRPVTAMATLVDEITTTNLDRRVPISGPEDELRALAETMNRMLGRLQRSRDRQRRFVSDASHELRSPVTAMAATLELAAAGAGAADPAHAVLQAENQRLAALVDDLLLVATLDEGAAGPAGASVDLEEICLAEAERSHPVPVRVRVEAPARVLGDETMLERACRNLIDNAARHAATGVDVTISVDHEAAVVVVADDGPGVPDDQLDAIFERFARGDAARTRLHGSGAGLGLAIVQGVAAAHGGSVTAANGVPGARFTLRIPRR